MDAQVVQPIFDAVDAAMNGTLVTGTSSLMKVAGGIFGTFWVMHFTLKSLYWLQYGLDMAVKDIVSSMLRVAFVCSLAFTSSTYMEAIVPFVSNAPAGITKIITGSESNATNQIDVLFGSYLETVIKVAGSLRLSIFNSEISDLAFAIITLAILIISGITFLVVCASTLIILKLSTTIFLVVGPVFIAFFLFDATKQYAWGWINLIAGFMLTNVLFGVVVSIEINYINVNLIDNDGMLKFQWANLFAMPLIFGAFTALAQAIPGYAASIMGGSPVSNAGGVGAMLNYGGVGTARKIASALGKFTPKGPSIK